MNMVDFNILEINMLDMNILEMNMLDTNLIGINIIQMNMLDISTVYQIYILDMTTILFNHLIAEACSAGSIKSCCNF
jgi:hypothetical protein